MVEKTVAGKVFDMENNVVGEVSGTYIDESQNSFNEQIVSRTIAITVQDEEDNIVGSGQLQYDDYVSHGPGGTRTIELNGNVQDEESNVVGNVSGKLDDRYGSVINLGAAINVLMQLLPLIILILIIVMIVSLVDKE